MIVLRHLLEYTPGEIGSLLGLPRGTVNSRLRRGLDALALALAEAMNENELRRLARGVEIDGEAEARRRTLNLVRSALSTRAAELPSPPCARTRARDGGGRGRRGRGDASPDDAVVNSLRDTIGRERVVGGQPAAAELLRLPAGGRLLVGARPAPGSSPSTGAKRLLGPYSDASWSPHGLFVVTAQKRDLLALDPHGRIRWSLATPAPSTAPTLVSGRLPDRLPQREHAPRHRRRRNRRPPALRRPAATRRGLVPQHRLSTCSRFVDPNDRLRLVDADSGRTLWTVRVPKPATLAWTHERPLPDLRQRPGTVVGRQRNGRVAYLRRPRAAATRSQSHPDTDAYALAGRNTAGQSTVLITDLRSDTGRDARFPAAAASARSPGRPTATGSRSAGRAPIRSSSCTRPAARRSAPSPTSAANSIPPRQAHAPKPRRLVLHHEGPVLAACVASFA